MLSRVADSIYWLNRYVERAENVARFLDVNLNLLLDLPSGVQQQWEPLVVTTGDLAFFKEHYGEATAESVTQFLVFDKNYPNSVRSCLYAARENARSVREIISSEMWEHVNAAYMMIMGASQELALADLITLLAEIKKISHLFAGLMDATMSRGEGWNIGQMGRFLERADKTSRILDVKYYILLPSPEDVGTPADELGWMALLKSASAYEMYRKWSTQHRITPAGVVQFLMLDPQFPRSIRFCLYQVERSLHNITGTPAGLWRSPVERTLGRIRSELEYVTIEEVIMGGVHDFLDRLQQKMNQLDQDLFATFFCMPPIDPKMPVQTQSQTQIQR